MHHNFEDNEYVKFLGALSDLNQPYSCTQWGNAPDGGYSQIIHDTGSSIYSMLTPNNYVPATVWIDHKMRVHDQMNTAGSWSISSRINSMLEGCGECRIDGELIDDSVQGENHISSIVVRILVVHTLNLVILKIIIVKVLIQFGYHYVHLVPEQ